MVTYDYPEARCVLTYEMRIWTPYPLHDEAEGAGVCGDNGFVVIGNSRWRAFDRKGQQIKESPGGDDTVAHVRNFLDCTAQPAEAERRLGNDWASVQYALSPGQRRVACRTDAAVRPADQYVRRRRRREPLADAGPVPPAVGAAQNRGAVNPMKPRRRKQQEPLGLQLFQSPPSDEHGLPLDELTQAYADLIARGDDPYTPLPDPDAGPAAILDDEEPDEGEEAADDAADRSEPPEPADREAECEVSPRTILEAMLFVGHPENQPLTSEKVASLMRGVRAHEIDELVVELNRTYDEEGCPYRIESVGAGYRLALRDEFHSLRDVFYGRVKAAKLSQAAVDVLAIVAYKQPLTREDVDALRGRPSGSLLAQLVRRQLLRVERSHDQPRTPRFCTTDRFLQLFGLQGLRDLPQSPE